MARDYEEWNYSQGARDSLHDQVQSTVFGEMDTRSAEGVQRLQEQFGREEVTAQLAGTRDKSTRAWKSARDSLSAWRSGRRGVSETSAERLQEAGRGGQLGLLAAGGRAVIGMDVTVRTSKATWSGRVGADLTGRDLRDFVEAMERGDTTEAVMIGFDAYGLDPEYIIELVSVSNITVNGDA